MRGAGRPAGVPATDVTLDRLRSATQQAQAVRVGYVTADGRTVERELALLDLVAGLGSGGGPGQCTGRDHPARPHLGGVPLPDSDPSVTS